MTAVSGCSALALLSTGEILVVNANDIAQFTPDGNLESTVTGGTIVASAGSENPSIASAFQPNGDIVVVGLHSSTSATVNALARLTPNGSFDSAFGTDGIVTNSVPAGTGGLEGVVVQPADGQIVTVGTAKNLAELTISRYLAQ